jgi:hypothetical protein
MSRLKLLKKKAVTTLGITYEEYAKGLELKDLWDKEESYGKEVKDYTRLILNQSTDLNPRAVKLYSEELIRKSHRHGILTKLQRSAIEEQGMEKIEKSIGQKLYSCDESGDKIYSRIEDTF